MSKYCSSGSCISPSCTSYTNTPKHTSCGSNNECDGSGTCITCTSHSYTGCWYNDVYYYDACDNREDKKDECGNDGCSDWYRDTCHGDDAYETQLCYSKGCTTTASFGVHCYSNRYENERFVETCQYGCINGNCKPNPNIACFFNKDCGKDGSFGYPWCFDNDVYRWIREYTCNYPGTEQSFCSSEDYSTMIDNCREDEYSSNYCYDDDVYQNFTDRGCSDGACFENVTTQKVQECGDYGCTDDKCNFECYNDLDCETDSWLNQEYCCSGSGDNDDVCDTYRNYTCHNPGTINATCIYIDEGKAKQDCGDIECENWGDLYCYDGDVWHNRSCTWRGCNSSTCYENSGTEDEKLEECGDKVCIDGECVSGDFPDLEVSNLRLMWPPNPKVGEITSFEFMIKNIGKKGAENVEFNLDTGEFNWNPPQPITLGVGKEIYVAYDYVYNNSGIYIVTAIIDPENQIKEPNENNNQRSIIVVIS